MINKNESSVAWALLMYEIDDAREHLETLMRDMQEDAEFDEIDYRIQLGHVYAHLNRAWNGRSLSDEFHQQKDEISQAQWQANLAIGPTI